MEPSVDPNPREVLVAEELRKDSPSTPFTVDAGDDVWIGLIADSDHSSSALFSQVTGRCAKQEGDVVAYTRDDLDFLVTDDPPAWREMPGRRHKMMHVEIEVTDLVALVTRAIAAGATEAADQPADRDQSRIRIMLDPAGHPFCLFVAGGSRRPLEASADSWLDIATRSPRRPIDGGTDALGQRLGKVRGQGGHVSMAQKERILMGDA